MRIALVTSKLDPHHGGASVWTFALARWLLRRGHDVQLVGFDVAAKLDFPSKRVFCLPKSRNRHSVAKELSAWLAKQSFDLVHDMGVGFECDFFHSHFGSLSAMESATRRSRTAMQRLCHSFVGSVSSRKRTIRQIARKQFSNQNACFIAVSNMVADDLQRFEGIEKHRIRCVPNGVDTDRYNPQKCLDIRNDSRQHFAIAKDALVATTIAHNFKLKGVPELIRCVRQAQHFPSPIHLLVVGNHRQPAGTCAIGKHTITYTGALPGTEQVYASTDVYVHPTFYDACSLSALEAMACGVPTITTKKMVRPNVSNTVTMGLLFTTHLTTKGYLVVSCFCSIPVIAGNSQSTHAKPRSLGRIKTTSKRLKNCTPSDCPSNDVQNAQPRQPRHRL